jgi:tetratricopeptide (TPR) repeat protein
MARAEPTGFPGPSKPVYDRPELVERAVASLRKAAALFEKARDDADTWRTLFNIGVIFENSGDHNRAVAYYRRALAASDAAGERAKAEGRIACDTHDGSRLRGEFRGRDIQCFSFKAAFGSVSLVFDEDEWWNE